MGLLVNHPQFPFLLSPQAAAAGGFESSNYYCYCYATIEASRQHNNTYSIPLSVIITMFLKVVVILKQRKRSSHDFQINAPNKYSKNNDIIVMVITCKY